MRSRSLALGSPLFIVSVAALLANDHILKGIAPDWFTGKASDVAGVIMIGIIACVLLGQRAGIAVTGVVWVALKTVPGVAESLAPVLGGQTVRDPSDLTALAGLLAVWRSMPSAEPLEGRPVGRLRREGRGPAAWRRHLSAGSPLVIIAACIGAIFGTTATSCSPHASVVRVVNQDGAFFAEVHGGSHHGPAWARSEDGGQTWGASPAPSGIAPEPKPVPQKPEPLGPTEACTAEYICYRLTPEGTIQRTEGDGTPTTEYTPDANDKAGAEPNCLYQYDGALTSISVSADGDTAVTSFGSKGVLARTGAGQWNTRAVLDIPPPRPPAVEGLALAVLIVVGPLGAAFIFLIGKRRSWQGRKVATILAIIGWFGTLSLAVVPTVYGPVSSGVWGRGALACWAAGWLLCLAIARFTSVDGRPSVGPTSGGPFPAPPRPGSDTAPNPPQAR